MTISSSLNAGVAGLKANASRLASISDNIANSATDGYRRVRTDFASLTVAESPSRYVAGGVRSASTRLIDESGPLTASANATDIAVSGRGMLPVSSQVPPPGGSATTELRLTTTGAFRPDADGVLRDAQGQVLLGWPAGLDGTFPIVPRQSVAALEAVRIDKGWTQGAATTSLSIEANLPATATKAGEPGEPYTMTTEYYDPLGGLQTLAFNFTPQVPAAGAPPSNTWSLSIAEDAPGGAVLAEYDLQFSDARGTGGTLVNVTRTSATGGDYDPDGGSVELTIDGEPMKVNIGEIGRPGGLTQLSDSFAPAASRLDGAPAGTTASVEVRPDGTVRTISDSGFERTIYKIPLVDVPNPNGLVSETGTTFSVSSESGPFYLWDAGEGSTGTVEGFARQESATDVAGELTDLIQTQRAYSSNAKIIQTVDEMLQETTNLKR